MSVDLELIEDFLHGRLSARDKKSLEEKISSDAAFARLVEKERQLIDALSDERSRQFVNRVEDIIQTTPLTSRNRERMRRGVGIAIAASLLVVSGLLFFLPRQSQSTEAMFQTYFKSYPMLLAQRDASPGSFQDFVSVYQDEHWDEVIRMAANPDLHAMYPNLIDLYQCIAHLHKGEAREAIGILQEKKDLDQDLSIAFLWYQSMAHLQLGDRSQAKVTLTHLIDHQPGGSWQKDAQQILQDLE